MRRANPSTVGWETFTCSNSHANTVACISQPILGAPPAGAGVKMPDQPCRRLKVEGSAELRRAESWAVEPENTTDIEKDS